MTPLRRWKDVSIVKKLNAIVGVMAVLIITELIILSTSMRILSSTRAFISGESLWSKAQKDSALQLKHYLSSHKDTDYEAFLSYLSIPDGDHRARLELGKAHPDYAVMRSGFEQGQVHPDDIPGVIWLLQQAPRSHYISDAIGYWSQADDLLVEFKAAASEYRDLVQSGVRDPRRLEAKVRETDAINDRLTILEARFSNVLGEGSRALEHFVVFVLLCLVMTVESVGLTLTYLITRKLSRGLAEIGSAASAIGRGDFKRTVEVDSRDELGDLANSVNVMGKMLERSYSTLESRVQQRTEDLSRALKTRDEFLSIASHELKTPLTSLKLQCQLRRLQLKGGNPETFSPERLFAMIGEDEKQIDRIDRLVSDMLDIARIRGGRLSLVAEELDLSQLTESVVEKARPQLEAARCELTMDVKPTVKGRWDGFRLEQVLLNLITNAIKYGQGKPVHVTVKGNHTHAWILVEDRGIGIAREDQSRIFLQFERATTQSSGLGLGLFIVQQIVEAHGGTVSVDSELGKGSKFKVELPISR